MQHIFAYLNKYSATTNHVGNTRFYNCPHVYTYWPFHSFLLLLSGALSFQLARLFLVLLSGQEEDVLSRLGSFWSLILINLSNNPSSFFSTSYSCFLQGDKLSAVSYLGHSQFPLHFWRFYFLIAVGVLVSITFSCNALTIAACYIFLSKVSTV